jgi:nucleotide-binding universal stress UspA family protein
MTGGDRDALRAGALVDGFRLEGELPGGWATAHWRVTRPQVDFPMVLKVPRDGNDGDTGLVRFQVEQLVLPRLTGPHVPRFVAAGEVAGLPYLVTELVAGPSLHDRFAAVMFAADDVARLGARVAAALQQIHGQQVVHLDLKPRSVIFRKGGDVVLVDFGLARHAQLPDLIAEQFREPLGTGAYMAPEQVLGVRSDHRSDIFALGAILYHLIAGKPPFGSPTNIDGLRRRIYHDAALPQRVNPSCPDWLQEVILGCLEADPARRYQGAEQVGALLRDPGQVRITRAPQRARRGFFASLAQRLPWRVGSLPPLTAARPAGRVATMMVAVDLSGDAGALAEALRSGVRRAYEYRHAARLACVTVRTLLKVGVVDASVDHAGRNLRLQRLAELKHWALPLGLSPERVTFHVLESDDPAAALVEYARENRVDHVVIGASGSSSLRRILGSVSARVVTEAPCTVTVVRAHHGSGNTREPHPAAPPA